MTSEKQFDLEGSNKIPLKRGSISLVKVLVLAILVFLTSAYFWSDYVSLLFAHTVLEDMRIDSKDFYYNTTQPQFSCAMKNGRPTSYAGLVGLKGDSEEAPKRSFFWYDCLTSLNINNISNDKDSFPGILKQKITLRRHLSCSFLSLEFYEWYWYLSWVRLSIGGGPGSSGLLNGMNGLSPCSVGASIVPEFNPSRWTEHFNLLLLDHVRVVACVLPLNVY